MRNLKGIDIKRFLPLVEMTIDAFLSFEITSNNYLLIEASGVFGGLEIHY